MDKRLILLPAAALTSPCVALHAQQTASPVSEAEQALRARAEKFFQLEKDGKFRQAESLVAEDTKDYFYDSSKPEVNDFSLMSVEFTDPTHATVKAQIKTVMRAPSFPPLEVSTIVVSSWKLEGGDWYWYLPPVRELDTPFGKMTVATGKGGPAPSLPQNMVNPNDLAGLVTVDKTTVELNGDTPSAVTISNHLGGSISIRMEGQPPRGLRVGIPKPLIGASEQGTVSFQAEDGAMPSGTVTISAGPMSQFEITVRSH